MLLVFIRKIQKPMITWMFLCHSFEKDTAKSKNGIHQRWRIRAELPVRQKWANPRDKGRNTAKVKLTREQGQTHKVNFNPWISDVVLVGEVCQRLPLSASQTFLLCYRVRKCPSCGVSLVMPATPVASPGLLSIPPMQLTQPQTTSGTCSR